MLAVHEELVRPRVMAAVEDLGEQEASGVLEISGSPSGAVYLDGGRITFARASWVPGLAARVCAVSSAPGARAELAAWDADDAAIATLAVTRGYVTGARLHELITSIVIDALLVLTTQADVNAPAAVRFVSTRTYWTDEFPRLDPRSVRAEAISRAHRLADYGLSPATAVALCELRRPSAVLTREQWTMACKIIKHASARDIALRDGAGLADTADCLGALIRAGVCAPVRVREHRQPAPAPTSAAMPDGLPSRRTEPASVERPEARLDQPPSIDILRQVLDGLRNLN